MGGQSFNVQTDGSGLAAKALRADAQSIDLLKHFIFQFCVEGVGMMGVQGAHNGLLGQQGGLVESAADAHTDDHGRTRVGAGIFHSFQDEILDALQTCRGLKHPDGAHVLAAEALGAYGDLHLVTGDDLGVEHGGGVVAGVATTDGIAYHGLAQIALVVATADAFVHGKPQIAAHKVDILADLQEDTGHAGVLTDGDIFPVSNIVVFNDVIQHALGDFAVLAGAAALNGALYITGQVVVGFNAQPLHHIGDLADFNFTHSLPPFSKFRLSF